MVFVEALELVEELGNPLEIPNALVSLIFDGIGFRKN